MGVTARAYCVSGLAGQSKQSTPARTCFRSESLAGVGARRRACCTCALGFTQAAAAAALLFSLSWHRAASSDRCIGLHQRFTISTPLLLCGDMSIGGSLQSY